MINKRIKTAEKLDTVHTHTHTHTSSLLVNDNRINIIEKIVIKPKF